ncbi:polysaccharide pyruvyl transferase family protein [Vibrio metschnikovii]|nr:polysaccharide pyruvyl transferase family protein [Vibrio metschnikovii]EKO3624873.1 polysaccharide pyruvyl transferase family protein [Vibrio metschnikovii]EKO3705502.1 polysaccharide pyruvyl transferase family protein [Vibrio metschnikovii]
MTQPLGHNYGGMIQAWALQRVLINQGHEVITINRLPENRGLLYNSLRLAYRTVNKVVGRRKVPVNFESKFPYVFKKTIDFIADNIVTSEPLDTTATIKAHFERENYDAVIVGSDQTWRPQYSPNIDNYFLDFCEGLKIKRIAYATSFGVDEWEFSVAQTKRCAELAKQFSAISVREDSGVELCRRFLGVDAEHVLDPTLLLDKSDYEELIGSDRLKDKNTGIYTYFLDKSPDKISFTKLVEEISGESAYSCQAKYGVEADMSSKLDDYIMPDPRDWLAGFANAKYVLTDSFHGMVFAIVFNKPFFVINNKSRGAARFLSLLNLINKSDRILNEVPSISNETIESLIINSSRINPPAKFSSEKFLVNAINGK